VPSDKRADLPGQVMSMVYFLVDLLVIGTSNLLFRGNDV